LILVFGAHGQLGQELAVQASANAVSLAALGRDDADICDVDAVERAIARSRPTLVVNAAAYNGVDLAEHDRVAAFATNAAGPENLARVCGQLRIPLVHISTDFVFDGRKTSAYTEDDPTMPLGVYGQSKAEGEAAVRRASEQHFILRTAWLYGIYGSNFLKTIVRLAGERDEIAVVTDRTGSPTSTADLAKAILTIANQPNRGADHYGTYHVAGAGTASRYEFACAIVAAQARFTEREARLVPITSANLSAPAGRPQNSVLDSSKIKQVFGFRPENWRTAVDRTIAALFSERVAS
jgi:dTDP-4-dehydrorhamnose reductase